MLAMGGGALGVMLAYVTHRVILAFEPGIIPRAEELALDTWALAFAVVVSLLTGLLFGLAPAFHGSRVDLQTALKQGGSRGMTVGRGQNRTHAVLVTMQLGLATMLLCGAGLLVRSMLELRKVDPGFSPGGTLAARFFLDERRYDSADKLRQYFLDLGHRLRALPGVQNVGATSALPMDPVGVNYDLPYRLVGQEDLTTEELPEADFRVVTPGYFETIGVPLIAGRTINEFDRPETPFVALVNQAMHWFEVVGVVGDTRYYGLDSDPRPEIYVAHAQVPREYMNFVVRTTGDPTGMMDTVRREVVRQDPDQPSHSVVTMESLVADTIAAERFYTLVLGIFAAVAVLLSAAGIYGVLSYWVNQRTSEIGVRMALGATRADVLRNVVGHGMALTGFGVAAGLAGAVASTRVLANSLFEVGARDPGTFAGVAVLLIGIALLACWVPAQRASRVDPVTSLREE
jgi:putative ABC transport system permease protein